ncbi:hypothetical protein [Tunturiibacter gelidiferens]|uniref:Uncharacterized protein n=1 Tax=Tunturiibacter gelidiferens TaxID=3069689 RepID=A0AAU7YZZ7_9BACT
MAVAAEAETFDIEVQGRAELDWRGVSRYCGGNWRNGSVCDLVLDDQGVPMIEGG